MAAAPDPRTIAVTGVARSGTSLMCIAMRKKGFMLIEDPAFSKIEDFGNRGECEVTVNGIYGKRAERFRTQKQYRFVKIVYRGLLHTPIEEINDLGHIIVMHRPWRAHQRSVTHTQKSVLRRLYAGIETDRPFDEFFRDVAGPTGVHFGMGYLRLLTDAINRKYLGKMTFVDMDAVLANPDAVSEQLMKSCGVWLDGAEFRERPAYEDDTVYTEFEPGFFTFLDQLSAVMRGAAPLDGILKDFAKWGIRMADEGTRRQQVIKAKYGVDLSPEALRAPDV